MLIVLGCVLVRMSPYSGPYPIYFEVAIWPFLCLSLAHRTTLTARLFAGIPSIRGLAFLERWCLPALVLPVVVVAVSFRPNASKHLDSFPYLSRETVLIERLRHDVGIQPGEQFRGSVATFTGFADKPEA